MGAHLLHGGGDLPLQPVTGLAPTAPLLRAGSPALQHEEHLIPRQQALGGHHAQQTHQLGDGHFLGGAVTRQQALQGGQ